MIDGADNSKRIVTMIGRRINYTSSKPHLVLLGELSEGCEVIRDLLLEGRHITTALQDIANTVLLETLYKLDLLLIPTKRFRREY